MNGLQGKLQALYIIMEFIAGYKFNFEFSLYTPTPSTFRKIKQRSKSSRRYTHPEPV